jgi:hypothetical protein
MNGGTIPNNRTSLLLRTPTERLDHLERLQEFEESLRTWWLQQDQDQQWIQEITDGS